MAPADQGARLGDDAGIARPLRDTKIEIGCPPIAELAAAGAEPGRLA
jgi:hypothetical protein